MQTTHKIPGDSATSYAQYLTSAAARGDYYTNEGGGGEDRDRPVPSRWHGSRETLDALGLSAEGPVGRADLRAVMKGRSPRDGQELRPAGSDGTRVAGVELMMAPPKTVSALWAVSDPYRRAQIEAAHRQAVESALERTEREVALVRRKENGVVRFERAERLLAAEFVHTTSRLGQDQESDGIPDPQLHSHVVVFAAQRGDGKLAAVESRQLYKSARENGAWYRAELAANLQDLGLRLDRRTGKGERYFELQGVPEELAERWSRRSEDVDRAARVFRQRYGREPRAGELGSITTSTRGSKSAAKEIDVNSAWRAQGEEHGLGRAHVEGLFNERSIDDRGSVDLRRELIATVTSERSTVTEHELRAKAYELSAGVCRPVEMDQLMGEMMRSGELLRLDDGTWTTRRLREQEQTTVQVVQQRASENAARVSEQALQQARREIGKEIHSSLTREQIEALRRITGPGGVAVLVGRAGTGKGVTIAAAARAWRIEGKEVIGTAVAGATAKRLGAETKLDRATTTDSLLNQIEKGNIRLDRDTVVVMDEAGMADSDRLSRLVQVTAERDSKLLLAGDSAQLSAIGAGGLFKEIEGKVPTAELTEVHRARHDWERRAWEQIRNGQPGPALAQYEAHDRLHIHDTRAQAAEAMVENWDRTRRETPDGQAVMITDASNKERDQINAIAQERRAQAGELGTERVQISEKPYGLAVGDEVIFTAQYRVPGEQRVENGITGTVIDTSPDPSPDPRTGVSGDANENRNGERHEQENTGHVTIKTREHEPRDVDVNTSEFSDISLAYAIHLHKAQGLTAETSGILTGGWQTDQEHTYVAVSRAREQTQIYIAREDLGEQGMDTGAIERLAERMHQSRAQEASITKELAAGPTQEHPPNAEPPANHPSPVPTGERVINTPAQVDDIERRAEHMRHHGAQDTTIVKQISDEDTPPEDKRTRTTKEEQNYQREIEEIIKAQRQRQLDWERGIAPAQDNDRDTGLGIE